MLARSLALLVSGGCSSFCFSTSDGGTFRYLASGGDDGLVALWELDDFVCVRTIECE